MQTISSDEIDSAQTTVYATMAPTPQYAWPLLRERLGTEIWVKHENHTPLGAFKLRGGLVYLRALAHREPACPGVISATRGNHGQSVAFAAQRQGLSATIVVPHGNSVEKNAAMRALGAELVEQGHDFQEAREHAVLLAGERGLHYVPSFHRDLVLGVASYWIEFFRAVQPAVVFVPVGLGSGICACITARAHTGAATRIVGVVSAHATAYLDSYRAGHCIEAPTSTVLADGMACRVAEPEALELIRREVDDVVSVTDDEVASAMRLLFSATHNVAEGAGAASLAAATQQAARWRGRSVGVTLCGGNVDRALFARVLAGEDGEAW
ncbi:MAG: threonine dehydratase [Pseudomonadota bacterium]